MNKEIKAQWVAALRSGEYKQGKGQLRKDDAFCCLGVLCNLHAQAHPKIAAAQECFSQYMGYTSFPAPGVVKWAGLRTDNPLVTIDGDRGKLSEFNDGSEHHKRTFAEIADAIEAQL